MNAHKLAPALFLFSFIAGQDSFIDVNNVTIGEDDLRRNYFCGTSSVDASDKCGTWCPNQDDNECPEGEQCYTDTYCKYTADLTVTNSTTSYDDNSSILQPSQESDISIEEEDWSDISIEEDWSTTPSDETTKNLWCGLTLFDAIRNCGTGSSCDDGICSGGLKCFVVPGSCGDDGASTVVESSDDEEEEDWSDFIGSTLSPSLEGTTTTVPTGVEATDTGTTSTLALNSSNYTEEDWSEFVNASTIAPSTTTTIDYFTNSSNATNQPVAGSNNDTFATSPTPTVPADSPSFSQPEDQTDITLTFFCGTTKEEATTSCHKRCQTGSPAECDSGETCFGYTTCTEEIPRPPPTSRPTQSPTLEPTMVPSEPTTLLNLPNLCAEDFVELQTKCWTAEECNATHPCSDNQTCFENIDCVLTSYSNTADPTGSPITHSEVNESISIGTKQNYCAANEEDLESNCMDAPTCNDGDPPCSIGTFCFGQFVCEGRFVSSAPTETAVIPMPSLAPVLPPSSSPMTESTPLVSPPPSSASNEEESPQTPTEPQLFCASSMTELEASCASAQSCNSGPCPKGLFCFPYTCEILSEATTEPPAPAVVSDGKTYYCAQNPAVLKQSCGMLAQCNNGLPPCPENTVCLEYDCEQSVELCPLNYVGWQSSRDCLEYYECEHGVAGPINYCSDGLKFDKMRGECTNGSGIDEYCYGPPVPKPTPRPSGPPLTFCPGGVDGWHTSTDCKEFYRCEAGVAGAIQVCEEGTKFDKVRNKCRTDSWVNNFCYGPPLDETESQELEINNTPPESNTDSKVESNTGSKPLQAESIQELPKSDNDSCLNGYSGWEASSDCSKYYWCDKGLPGKQYDCGDGLLFDRNHEICTFADEVVCVSKSIGNAHSPPPSQPPIPTAAKMSNPPTTPTQTTAAMGTFFPTFSTGKDKVWSDTPTMTQSAPADPPWLSITRKDENGASHLIACVYLQFFVFLIIQF